MPFSFIQVIVPQSKAHILRRLPKIGKKVIENAYVSGQCRQTKAIAINLLKNNNNNNNINFIYNRLFAAITLVIVLAWFL